tara:strand:+ start:366 stop:737 length:372 start_codon:yes stop_codon:yes gene_type:complete
MKGEENKYLTFKKKDIQDMLNDTGVFIDRALNMLTTCLLKEGGFNHPKYDFLIELLCESYSVNNKLKHFLEKTLEYSSIELEKGIETVYVDSQVAFVLETLVMSKIMNASDLQTEVNLSMSIH